MDYQLKGLKDQADDIDAHYKLADKGFKEFEDILNQEEHKRIVEELEEKMWRVKVLEGEYDELGDEEVQRKREQQICELEDIIVDNKLLLDGIDKELEGKTPSDRDGGVRDSSSSFSSTLLDEMYSKAKSGPKKTLVNKRQPVNHFLKSNN